MAKENITVLMDLLQRLEQDRQLLESPVDLNTLKLCTHELETYREQLSKDNRSTVRYDRIEKFLDFMRNNQLLNAKDISGQALSDYQDIQTMSFERNPLFEVKYWHELTENQKEKKLADIASSPRYREKTKNSNSQYDEQLSVQSKSSKGQHVTQINVFSKDRVSMTENGPRRDKNLQLSRTSGKVTSPSKVDSQKHKTNQPQFINDLEVSSGSARTKPDNEVSEDKAVINAVENTRRMIDIEQAPVESDQESVGTWRSPKKTGLHGRSNRREIYEQFMQVYHQYYITLYNSIIRQQKFSSELVYKELLGIVRMIADVCESFAKGQIHNMQMCVDKVLGDGTAREQVKDDIDEFLYFEFRRLNAELSLNILYQRCSETIKCNNDIQTIYSSWETERIFADFLFACVEVIWYMTIQESPAVLEYDAATDQDALLLFYGSTRGKQRLDRVIWPAIRCFKDRSILAQGVAHFIL